MPIYDNKKFRLISSLLLLIIAFSVLSLSLSTANKAFCSEEKTYASQKKFYLGEEVLPDHVAYPFLMVIDRLKLETAFEKEKPYIEVEYAFARLSKVKKLLQKDQIAIAHSTLTKSQKYLLKAAQDAQNNTSINAKKHVYYSISKHSETTEALMDEFSNEQKNIIHHLLKELEIAEQKLDQSISSSADTL